MITSLFLYILGFILSLVVGLMDFIAKDFTIWPSQVLDGLTYFFTHLMSFDFFLNIASLLTAIKWLVGFLIVYVSIKILLRFINWMRGSGELDI